MTILSNIELSRNWARNFLFAIFGEAVAFGFLIAIWSKADRRTRFFDSCDRAAEYAIARAASSDVYFGCGLYRDHIGSGRGKADDVTAVTGVWVDADFHHESVHPRGDLPSSWPEASGVFKKLGLAPSIVIDTGYGVQAYLLFDSPWYLRSEEDRLEAKEYLRAWGFTVQSIARTFDWELDSVFDLARVFRVPGTLNHKVSPSRPVRTIHTAGPLPAPPIRYTRDQIAQRFAVAPVFKSQAYTPRPRPELLSPSDKSQLMRARAAKNGAKLIKLWNGEWSDYRSQSEADLALCGILAFWLGPDPQRVDRVFRASGLCRTKWDEAHFVGGRTYGQATVQKVLEGRSTFHRSARRGRQA